jgi:hypothetical protein
MGKAANRLRAIRRAFQKQRLAAKKTEASLGSLLESQRSDTQKLIALLSPSAPSSLRRRSLRVARIIGAIVAVLTLVATLDQIFVWGPLWPADPEIHPVNSANGSSLVTLFTVQNRNHVLYPITNVEFTCGLGMIYFSDANGHTGIATDIAFVTGEISIPSTGLNYRCDATRLVVIRPDGALDLYGSMNTAPGGFRAPLKILKMCVWIRGSYRLWWIFPRRFTSTVFQWPESSQNLQWVEGPIAEEAETTAADLPAPYAAWGLHALVTDGAPPHFLLPGTLDCKPMTFPYVAFRKTGKPYLLTGD